MELLRFTTAGSVDDGKSTLIGRLLHDAGGAYEDQIAAVRRNGALDLALLTDGLRAEREQGITIDVAYRYFSTPRRKFIIADTPGHEQYTRNMATGASTADVAVILIDARHGVLRQSRRHASIARLLGIPRLVVAVNKMDLVDWRRDIFDSICADFGAFLSRFDAKMTHFVPLSALSGDNVVRRSSRTPWYGGPSLLEYLEEVPVGESRDARPFRFPVQCVLRPNRDFRGYAGQVASGVVRPGDEVLVLPWGRRTRVKEIVTWDGDLAAASPPMSVALTIEDEIDIARGDMLAVPASPPHAGRRLEAHIVWMSETPLVPGRSYILKHTTRQVRATVTAIRHRLDIDSLEEQAAGELRLNDIGAVALETQQPLFFDPYSENRATGSLILIDPATNETAAAAMITAAGAADERAGRVTAEEREARYGHPGLVIWLEGSLDAAYHLERKLFDLGCNVCVLEEDEDAGARAAAAARAAGLVAICVGRGGALPPCITKGYVISVGENEVASWDPRTVLGSDGGTRRQGSPY